MDSWLVALIGIQMAFTAVVIYIVFQHKNAKAQRHTELQARLIERFDSAEELVRFLSTDEGRQLMSSIAAPQDKPGDASMTGFKAALILFSIGIAFVLLRGLLSDSGFLVPALLCLTLAAGIAAASYLGMRSSQKARAEASNHSDLLD